MNGRPAGGAMFRRRTDAENAAIDTHDQREADKRSALPHGVCPIHGISRRDGTAKAFLMKYGCPRQEDGLCGVDAWEDVVCPTKARCNHGT